MTTEQLHKLITLARSLPHASVYRVVGIAQEYASVSQSLVPEVLAAKAHGLVEQAFPAGKADDIPEPWEFVASGGQPQMIDSHNFKDTFLNLRSTALAQENFWRQRIHPVVRDIAHEQTWRFKSFPSWQKNVLKYGLARANLDILGARFVPSHPREFSTLVVNFESTFIDKIAYRLNTLGYTENELITRLSPVSQGYRAIHYYLPLGSGFFEVQFRTPAIDVWSRLHHATVYKPKPGFTLDLATQDALTVFARAANIVDWHKLVTHLPHGPQYSDFPI